LAARSAGDAARRARPHLAQALVQRAPLARDVLARRPRQRCELARASDDRPPRMTRQRSRGGRHGRSAGERPVGVSREAARRRAEAARASPQCSGTAVSAACVGVEQATAATSSMSVRSAWWPTDEMTARAASRPSGTASRRRTRNRSANDPPPRATTMTSTFGDRREIREERA
jgi:hypothetical protein